MRAVSSDMPKGGPDGLTVVNFDLTSLAREHRLRRRWDPLLLSIGPALVLGLLAYLGFSHSAMLLGAARSGDPILVGWLASLVFSAALMVACLLYIGLRWSRSLVGLRIDEMGLSFAFSRGTPRLFKWNDRGFDLTLTKWVDERGRFQGALARTGARVLGQLSESAYDSIVSSAERSGLLPQNVRLHGPGSYGRSATHIQHPASGPHRHLGY